MGDVVGGLFGDEPDYVGDNIEAQKRSLSEAMEKGRTLADSQYARNLQAAFFFFFFLGFGWITPYGSLTWYNTNDPQEAQRLAENDRLNSFVNQLMGGSNNMDLNTIKGAANQFLGSDPVAARAAMNAINNGSLMEQARANYQPPGEGKMSALDAYNQAFQKEKAAYQKAVREYQQPNGDLGIGTMRQFKDPTAGQ